MTTLEPWSPDGARLETFMPDGFEEYARIFHRANVGKVGGDFAPAREETRDSPRGVLIEAADLERWEQRLGAHIDTPAEE